MTTLLVLVVHVVERRCYMNLVLGPTLALGDEEGLHHANERDRCAGPPSESGQIDLDTNTI